MPWKLAWTTVAGCIVTLIIGLLVTYRVQSAQYQSQLDGQLAVHHIAALIADTNKFPPVLVHGGVQNIGDKSSTTHI